VGWSKVQQLLHGSLASSQGTEGSSQDRTTAAGAEAGGGAGGSQETGPSAPSAAAAAAAAREGSAVDGFPGQPLEVEGVVELSPQELEQWRKVNWLACRLSPLKHRTSNLDTFIVGPPPTLTNA
jgi:hypothetical protein